MLLTLNGLTLNSDDLAAALVGSGLTTAGELVTASVKRVHEQFTTVRPTGSKTPLDEKQRLKLAEALCAHAATLNPRTRLDADSEIWRVPGLVPPAR